MVCTEKACVAKIPFGNIDDTIEEELEKVNAS